MIKYPKIWAFDKEEVENLLIEPTDKIIIQEKIDGANFRFIITEEGIIFGSRGRILEEEDKQNNFWKRCVEFIKEKTKNNKLYKNKYIFYGECCVRHTIGYDWEKIPSFLGFDIYDIEKEEFVHYPECKEMYEKLNLPFVPIIDEKKAKEITKLDEKLIPKSQYYEGTAEGIVLKNYKKQLFAKIVKEEFKEKNKEVFGKTKRQTENHSELFVAIYCTNARIEKCVFKLVAEGEALDNKIMHKLPKAVTEDIWEENWKEISCTQWSINFREINKQISRRCFSVLTQIIEINKEK